MTNPNPPSPIEWTTCECGCSAWVEKAHCDHVMDGATVIIVSMLRVFRCSQGHSFSRLWRFDKEARSDVAVA